MGRVPGGGNQVEDPVEDIAELRLVLRNQRHQTLAAGCPDHHVIAAALLPEQVQSGGLKANSGERTLPMSSKGILTPAMRHSVIGSQ